MSDGRFRPLNDGIYNHLRKRHVNESIHTISSLSSMRCHNQEPPITLATAHPPSSNQRGPLTSKPPSLRTQWRQNPQPNINPEIPHLVPIPLVITPRKPPQRHHPHQHCEIPHEIPRHPLPWLCCSHVAGDEADLEGVVPQREGVCAALVLGQRDEGGVEEAAVEVFESRGGDLDGQDECEGLGAAQRHSA